MSKQEELIKEFLITINYVSLLFVFHGFSHFRIKMVLTYLNYNNYRVVIQNCLIHYYSKLCIDKFIFLFHVIYIHMEFKSSISIKACITNTNNFIIKTNPIEKFMWCSAKLGKSGGTLGIVLVVPTTKA